MSPASGLAFERTCSNTFTNRACDYQRGLGVQHQHAALGATGEIGRTGSHRESRREDERVRIASTLLDVKEAAALMQTHRGRLNVSGYNPSSQMSSTC